MFDPRGLFRASAPTITHGIWQLFGFSVCALLVFMAALLVGLHRIALERPAVCRTEAIERHLRILGEDLLDAETGQRGYLLTQDGRYLKAYELGAGDAPSQIDALRQLTNDPAALANLNRIVPVVSAKLEELAATVSLTTAGRRDAAMQTVIEGSGQRLMDEFRALRAGSLLIEQRLLEDYRARLDARRSQFVVILLCGGVATIVFLFMSTRRTSRNLGEPIQALVRGMLAVDDNSLDRRLPICRPDEIGAAAAAFNTMTERLAAARRTESLARRKLEGSHAALVKSDAELTGTTLLLRAVLDSSTEVAIIAGDPDLSIKMFNAGAEHMLGYTSEEIVGRETRPLIHDPEEVHRRAEELSIELGRPIDANAVFTEPSTLRRPREWTYIRKDGRRITVSLVVTAMRTDAGELLGYVGVAHDVTRQKLDEAALRRAIGEAERANSAKSMFLANMSHEIRTPMNAVIGLTYLLQQTPLNRDQAAFIKQISVASQLLLSVITDVLDLSKIEAGELLISRVTFNPRDLVQGLGTIMATQAAAKGIVLEVDLAEEFPTALEGDAKRLNQILTNLLSNAIKFTERGSVTLSARQVAVTATGVALRFTVRDTGIGIPLEAQPRLFTPFIQADESITRRYGGTGLGLSIINSLTQLMGGTVNFTSSPGVGSEFRVDLEFAPAAPDSVAIAPPAPVARGELPLNDLSVLVVDDYDINLQVTKLILEQHGARVRLAANGMDAVAQLQADPAAIDVVLMDVQMPVLDGYEATRHIRTDLGLVNLPIIALTAGALSSERQRAADVGMNDFIIKPFDAPALIDVVERHSRRARRPAALSVDADSRPVPQATLWREIDGIDMDDARGRWCDDWDLFRSMLERLLSEFADIATAASWEVPGMAATQAARLHKLKGGASMLGAKAIRELGTLAEAACIAGDVAQAAKLSQGVATALQRLRVSALMAYEAARSNGPGPDAVGNAPLERTALADLVAQLRQMRTSALTDFKGLSPLLRRLLGAESFALLRTRMDALEFDEVADALDALAAA